MSPSLTSRNSVPFKDFICEAVSRLVLVRIFPEKIPAAFLFAHHEHLEFGVLAQACGDLTLKPFVRVVVLDGNLLTAKNAPM